MTKIAVIPARGGSKRIPRKNIREFANKPIIGYSIDAAIQSNIFDKIIVSTDDSEIANVARKYGAEVPFIRPAELSDDYTGTIDVIAHSVNWLISNTQIPEAVCCIYPTAPFIHVDDLKEGLKLLKTGLWQYVFSATNFNFPIFRSIYKQTNDGIKMFFPEHFSTRSQDLPQAFHDAGQFYWGTTQAWLEKFQLFDKWSTIVELPSWRVQDIDTLDDWRRAEILYQILTKQ